jgi:hypothetical protein
MSDRLGDVLRRQVESWQASGLGWPRAPWDEDIAPFIWVGEPDHEGWCAWRPARKEGAALADALGGLRVHPSLHSYFDNWWFLSLEGSLGETVISFKPNRPGLDPQAWVDLARAHAGADQGCPDYVPIGLEDESGLQVVVDNRTGELAIEDWERGSHEVIAESLDDALRRLVV